MTHCKMLVKNLMPYRFAAYADDARARLFIYWENALELHLAYFSKIVFAYKVGLFFRRYSLTFF